MLDDRFTRHVNGPLEGFFDVLSVSTSHLRLAWHYPTCSQERDFHFRINDVVTVELSESKQTMLFACSHSSSSLQHVETGSSRLRELISSPVSHPYLQLDFVGPYFRPWQWKICSHFFTRLFVSNTGRWFGDCPYLITPRFSNNEKRNVHWNQTMHLSGPRINEYPCDLDWDWNSF